MNREIKFRAWDKLNKIIHNNFKFISSGESGNDWVVFISDKFTLENPKTNPFINTSPYFSNQLKKMQFTGLKDKNGKDIYEDDILKDYYRDKKVRVIFKNGAFLTNDENGNGFISPAEDFEVIGNIYENKELLDDTRTC